MQRKKSKKENERERLFQVKRKKCAQKGLDRADIVRDARSAFTRWDEKAGLQRDAIRSQCSTCSRHKKETGNEED
jgi:hypothetical protein